MWTADYRETSSKCWHKHSTSLAAPLAGLCDVKPRGRVCETLPPEFQCKHLLFHRGLSNWGPVVICAAPCYNAKPGVERICINPVPNLSIYMIKSWICFVGAENHSHTRGLTHIRSLSSDCISFEDVIGCERLSTFVERHQTLSAPHFHLKMRHLWNILVCLCCSLVFAWRTPVGAGPVSKFCFITSALVHCETGILTIRINTLQTLWHRFLSRRRSWSMDVFC